MGESGGGPYKVRVCANGPYKVTGGLPLDHKTTVIGDNGIPRTWRRKKSYPDQDEYRLCRCGQSANMPYCDKAHQKIGFDGTETAGHETYLQQAKIYTGSNLILTDVEKFCSSARFCYRASGTWKLTKRSGNPKARETAIEEACDCPSGRLVARDKQTGAAIELDTEPKASITDDPQAGVGGPIWLQGGVPVESADGIPYERRNRVTLCRCGKSKNKPFCDSSHVRSGFREKLGQR